MDIKNTKQLIAIMKEGIPAEAALSGKKPDERDIAEKPLFGMPDYLRLTREGFSDAKMAARFSGFMPNVNSDQIEKMDKTLCKNPGETYLCPDCSYPLDEDSFFCKHCGKRMYQEIRIGEGMKKFRKDRGLTLQKLAEQIDCNTCTPHFWEAERNLPGLGVLKKIADEFKCSVDEVLGQPPMRTDFAPKPLICDEDKYLCPGCKTQVYYSIGEALTRGLDEYEDIRIFSDGNDGHYCKYCGQALVRPVKRDDKREFENYRFWLNQAAKKALQKR